MSKIFLKLAKFYHKKFILILLGIIVGLVFIEVLLRFTFSLTDKNLRGLHPLRTTITWQENSIVGNVLLSPNTKGWFVSPTHEYYTWIESNSEGFRDINHTTAKPADVYRILILGDSFVQNFQVPLEETFFRTFEKNLNQENKKIEVMALGLGNTGSDQQLIALGNFGLKYKPDLVIQMFFTGNDITNNYAHLNKNPNLPYFNLNNSGDLISVPIAKINKGKLSSSKNFFKNFVVVQLVLNFRQKLQGQPPDYHVYDKIYSSDFEKAWEITQKVLLKTKMISESSDAKYVLVSLANNEQVNPNNYRLDYSKIDFEKPDELLNEFCVNQKIDCLFMLNTFREFKDKNSTISTHYKIDGHWNKVGTDLAAEFLTKNLQNYFKKPNEF